MKSLTNYVNVNPQTEKQHRIWLLVTPFNFNKTEALLVTGNLHWRVVWCLCTVAQRTCVYQMII